jgi:hypothetical protein
MKNQNLLVNIRESALEMLTRSKNTAVLNPLVAHQLTEQVDDPAPALRITLQDLLVDFMDDQGQVDYAALKVSPAYAAFQSHTARLRAFDPATLATRPEKLAFWINLYNTLIMDAVIQLNVKRSVAERLAGVGFFRKAAYVIGGQRMSADDIEHGILRSNKGHPFFYSPQFRSDDPRLDWVITPFEKRIHFALNCASRSCPPIRAYKAEDLEAQLYLAAGNFVSRDLEIVPGERQFRVSTIYKWFAIDFGNSSKLIDFIHAHLEDQGSADWLGNNMDKIKISFKPFDWGLNGRT